MTSPVTYLTDEQYSALPVHERALHVARSQLGKEEHPRGSNWGEPVKTYLASAGVDSPAAWCAAFEVWCLKQAGYTGKMPKYPASTYWWWEFAKENGILHETPERGDLFVYNKQSGGHTGFVVAVTGETFRTFEGNTNTEGSREGYAVCERHRSIEALKSYPRWGFIRLKDLK